MASRKLGRQDLNPAVGEPSPIAATLRPIFPIVGIGASAGGLEALVEFFSHVPADTGMAYVVVQHLDPKHASLLAEILQRSSKIPVQEVTARMPALPNRVHIIPPDSDMLLEQGYLHLHKPNLPRAQRMPIDAFMRSLAEDQGEHCVGIILSGTGTDGTLGMRAVQGAGGLCLVQRPETAKYDGMPQSVIQAGYASEALAVQDMPAALLAHMSRPDALQRLPEEPAPFMGMNRILALLRTATGHDFTQYKKSTIGRRIERRMAQLNISEPEAYLSYMKAHGSEAHTLFRELLINVTSFFRDPASFDALKQEGWPALLNSKQDGDAIRIWVAGCSTGEEAYSIAMSLREFMDETGREFKVQLYATDLDDEAIALARAGVYPPNIVQDMSPERLRRFMIKEEGGFRIKKEIREMVVFAVQNVIKDPPFTKLDLLCCRNLMIYLEPALQQRLIPTFHYALKPDGMLFLSSSESIGSHAELFTPFNRKWKLYRAVHSNASTRAVMNNGLSWATDRGNKTPEEHMKKTRETNFSELTRRVLLQSYAPASVVTDIKGNILFVHGDTGNYLRPAPGQASLNVVEMAREGLQLELRAALHLVVEQGLPTLAREVAVKAQDEMRPVSFSLRPLPDPESGESLLMMSFQDLPRRASGAERTDAAAPTVAEPGRVQALEHELAYARESLQASIEELQASNEELKSTNEEMQSTNEELQSTNEELETSKEELQSVNEELVTVNAELQAKIEQLAGMQNDMKNLLDNLSVGTVFLDEHMAIRRFTREATRVYRLIASDIGRPLSDIKSDFDSDDLLTRASAVLETLIPWEGEVRAASSAWYLIRIQPYRTLDNVIEGVVFTFTDISKRVEAESAAQAARVLAEGIVDTVREPLLVLDGALKVMSASRSFYRDFNVGPEETLGRPIFELGQQQWNIPQLRELLLNVLPRDQSFENYLVGHEFPRIGLQRMYLNARRIVDQGGETQLILLALEGVGQSNPSLGSGV